MAFVSLASVTLRYFWPMLSHLRKILAHHISLREETALLGVGRDLWMIAVGTVAFVSNSWMQVGAAQLDQMSACGQLRAV